MDSDTLYKALKAGGVSPFQGYEWPLPERNGDGSWTPGEWVDAGEGELVECGHGIHACTLEQLPRWLQGELYVLEPAPGTDRLDGDDKTVLRWARLVRPVETWTETTARLFAADCAEMVLYIFEREHPTDDRPRRAIEAARAYARGEIDQKDLAAAGAAASAAASGAVSGAAGAAASGAANGATWDDVNAAMWSSASAAAWGVASGAVAHRLGLYLERGEAASEVPVERLEADRE